VTTIPKRRPLFVFRCHTEETPRKIFDAKPIEPKGLLNYFVIVAPSGKQWFVEILPDAIRMS